MDDPDQGQDNGGDFSQTSGVTINPGDQPSEVEEPEDDEGAGDTGVEKIFPDDPFLGGDVEDPGFGIEKRHHRRKEDIGGQGRFVDFVPEGVAVSPLDCGVGEESQRQDRQGIGRNGVGVGIEDLDAEIEIGQRGEQKDDPWQ